MAESVCGVLEAKGLREKERVWWGEGCLLWFVGVIRYAARHDCESADGWGRIREKPFVTGRSRRVAILAL